MAYNYLPQFYQPQVNMQPQLQTQHNGITWVQGENSAKSYPVMAGQSMLLMDSEQPVMYIKSTDQSGVPMPLRIFDYTERVAEQSQPPVDSPKSQPPVDYISREEFDTFKEEIKAEIKQAIKPTPVKKT